MSPSLVDQIQRTQPLTTITPRLVHTLTLDRLKPIIRIAHRQTISATIGPRVIVDHELVYVRSGRGMYRTADDVTPLQGAACVLVQPFVPHVFEPIQPMDHIAIHYDLTDSMTGLAGMSEREPYVVRLTESLQWPATWNWPREHPQVQAIERIVDDFAAGGQLATAAANTRLAMVLLDLLRSAADTHGRPHTNRTRIDRAVAWLDANLHRDVCVDDLADAAGLSASHFRRLFRDWAGVSVADFIQRTRIARARELLRDPDLTIKQIAARTGFAHPFHFSRVFRRIDGLSPTQFREAALAGLRR